MSGYMYIMASKSGALYVGSTNDLQKRIWQHKHKILPESHTAKYNINQLWYYEEFPDLITARAAEYKVKKWRRIKKLRLIESLNPHRKDLSVNWFD